MTDQNPTAIKIQGFDNPDLADAARYLRKLATYLDDVGEDEAAELIRHTIAQHCALRTERDAAIADAARYRAIKRMFWDDLLALKRQIKPDQTFDDLIDRAILTKGIAK